MNGTNDAHRRFEPDTMPSLPLETGRSIVAMRRYCPLADRVRRAGAPNELDAVGWAVRLLKRLHELHRCGHIHGDVSAVTLVTDGLRPTARARLLASARGFSPFAYQSPERLAGGRARAADDVWAAGVTLFYLLTGALPYPGNSAAEVRESMRAGRTALVAYGVTSRELEHVLERILAVSPSERVRDAEAVLEMLARWAGDRRILALPAVEEQAVADQRAAAPRRVRPCLPGGVRPREPEVDEAPTFEEPPISAAEQAELERAWLATLARESGERPSAPPRHSSAPPPVEEDESPTPCYTPAAKRARDQWGTARDTTPDPPRSDISFDSVVPVRSAS
jgi:hypothetical protein